MLTVNLFAFLLGVIMALPAALAMPFPSFFEGFIPNLAVLLLLFTALFLYIVLHEAIHGIFMKKYSNVKPHFGFKGIMYAYAASDAFFDKRSYMIIALAPVVLLGLVLFIINLIVPAAWFWFVFIIQIMNVSGATGDIYVLNIIRKSPADLMVSDAGVSMKIYSRS